MASGCVLTQCCGPIGVHRRAMPWWLYAAFLLATFAFSMVSLTLPHSDIAPHITWADWAAVTAILMHTVHFAAQLRKQWADTTTACCSKELILTALFIPASKPHITSPPPSLSKWCHTSLAAYYPSNGSDTHTECATCCILPQFCI